MRNTVQLSYLAEKRGQQALHPGSPSCPVCVFPCMLCPRCLASWVLAMPLRFGRGPTAPGCPPHRHGQSLPAASLAVEAQGWCWAAEQLALTHVPDGAPGHSLVLSLPKMTVNHTVFAEETVLSPPRNSSVIFLGLCCLLDLLGLQASCQGRPEYS